MIISRCAFQYEWHDDKGNWFRSYGNELWEFDDRGLMRAARRALTMSRFWKPSANSSSPRADRASPTIPAFRM